MRPNLTQMVLLLLLIAFYASSLASLAPIFHPGYSSNISDAVCMDGSKPAFYIRRGVMNGSDKWLIFFEGFMKIGSKCI